MDSIEKLGCRVKDRITGYTGVVVTVAHWLYGCVRLGVVAESLKDGAPHDPVWIDEKQCELLDRVIEQEDTAPVVKAAGPRPDPIRQRSDPR